MKSTRLNQKVNKDYNDSPVLAQIPETSSTTTPPGSTAKILNDKK